MESVGNAIHAMGKKGICAHGWQGPVDTHKLDGEYECYHCGQVFESADAIMDAHTEFLNTYC